MTGLSRAQKKQSSEFTEFSTKIWKLSNWVMPSAFICIEKWFHKKIKKILGLSKDIRVFESPILCIWQVECSVRIFRGPCLSIAFLCFKNHVLSCTYIYAISISQDYSAIPYIRDTHKYLWHLCIEKKSTPSWPMFDHRGSVYCEKVFLRH